MASLWTPIYGIKATEEEAVTLLRRMNFKEFETDDQSCRPLDDLYQEKNCIASWFNDLSGTF
jgi:hypothetical protein